MLNISELKYVSTKNAILKITREDNEFITVLIKPFQDILAKHDSFTDSGKHSVKLELTA